MQTKAREVTIGKIVEEKQQNKGNKQQTRGFER